MCCCWRKGVKRAGGKKRLEKRKEKFLPCKMKEVKVEEKK